MLGLTWVLGVLSQALSHIKSTLPLLSHFHSVYLLIPCYFQLYFPFPKCCFDLLCCLNFLLNWISFQKSLVLRPGVFRSGWTLGFSPRQQLPVCILLALSLPAAHSSFIKCLLLLWLVPFLVCDLSRVPLWLCPCDLWLQQYSPVTVPLWSICSSAVFCTIPD